MNGPVNYSDVIESAMHDTQSESVFESVSRNRAAMETQAKIDWDLDAGKCLDELFATFEVEQLRVELKKSCSAESNAAQMHKYKNMFFNMRTYS